MHRADLHLHTTASGDSILQPEEIFQQAAAAGLSAIAFTDHEGMAMHELGQQLAAKYGVEFLAGIEVNSAWGNELAHVLGYFPRGAGPSLQRFVRDVVWPATRRRGLSYLERLRARGFEISVAEYDAKGAEMGYLGSTLYQLVLDKDYVSDIHAYVELVRTLRIGYSNEGSFESPVWGYQTVPQVVAAIHEAGGFAVLAHPYAPPDFHVFDEEEIQALTDAGLDGIEVFHPTHLEKGVIERYQAIGDRLGLLQTGGSDSHDNPSTPHRRVGGMTCDWDVVRRWLEM